MSILSWLKRTFDWQTNKENVDKSSAKVISSRDSDYLQNMPLPEEVDNDLVEGYTFCATLQLRTPLRVIKHHNERFTGPRIPPEITDEQWQGIWLPKIKTWRELGFDLEEAPVDTMASDVGYVPSDGGDYLKFLLAIRGIVERMDPIAARLIDLKVEIKNKKWNVFVRKLGGEKAIIAHFFPRFIDTMPGLQHETVDALRKLKLTTPLIISSVPDDKLLSLKGIGPAKLKKIRDACSNASYPENEYVDIVKR